VEPRPLHRAAAKGNVARVEQLLLINPRSANAPDVVGLTPLEYAAHWGHLTPSLPAGSRRRRSRPSAGDRRCTARPPKDTRTSCCCSGNGARTSTAKPRGPLHAVARRGDPSPRRYGACCWRAGPNVEARTKVRLDRLPFRRGAGDEQTMTVLFGPQRRLAGRHSADQNPLELALANGHRSIVRLVQQRQSPTDSPAASRDYSPGLTAVKPNSSPRPDGQRPARRSRPPEDPRPTRLA